MLLKKLTVMSKNTTITLRVDKEIKEQAGEILESLGLTLSEAFNLMLYQVRIVRGLRYTHAYPIGNRNPLRFVGVSTGCSMGFCFLASLRVRL